MSIEKQINQAETNLQRKLDWVGRHDSRTTFVAGILIAMLGVLASSSSKVDEWTTFAYVVYGVTGVTLAAGLFFIYKCQYPQTESSNNSLNYFGTIAEMKFDEFKKKTLGTLDKDYLEDILYQTHRNSVILKLKFKYLKLALVMLSISILPWLAAIYLSNEYMK
jgi:hypothetical protein